MKIQNIIIVICLLVIGSAEVQGKAVVGQGAVPASPAMSSPSTGSPVMSSPSSGSPSTASQASASPSAVLAQTWGFDIINVDGDGNCFYRAVSQVINGNQEAHDSLRAITAVHVREDAALPLNKQERNALADEIAKNSRYSDEIDITALARHLNRPITVHGFRSGGTIADVTFGESVEPAIHIQFVPNYKNPWGPGHYKALIPRT